MPTKEVSPLTAAERNELERLYKASTQGEWWVLMSEFSQRGRGDDGRIVTLTTDVDFNVLIGDQDDRVCCCHDGECLPEANAAFIAAAHNAMPSLLNDSRRAKRLEAWIKSVGKVRLYAQSLVPSLPDGETHWVELGDLLAAHEAALQEPDE